MTTKLTLKLKKSTVERGKSYAKKRKTSFSKLVESYIDKITEEPTDFEVTPFVKSLIGTINPPGKNHKSEYVDYLAKKYK